jgi:hypothetical protein
MVNRLNQIVLWCIVRPGYGQSDGMPEYIHLSRRSAIAHARELNLPWNYDGCPIRFKLPIKLKEFWPTHETRTWKMLSMRSKNRYS